MLRFAHSDSRPTDRDASCRARLPSSCACLSPSHRSPQSPQWRRCMQDARSMPGAIAPGVATVLPRAKNCGTHAARESRFKDRSSKPSPVSVFATCIDLDLIGIQLRLIKAPIADQLNQIIQDKILASVETDMQSSPACITTLSAPGTVLAGTQELLRTRVWKSRVSPHRHAGFETVSCRS